MFAVPNACQTHQHKAGERSRFGETAVGSLGGSECSETWLYGPTSQPAHEDIAMLHVMEFRLSHRHQSRQCVRRRGKPHPPLPLTRDARPFKGQRWHFPPGHHSSECAIGQNRSGELTVVYVPFLQASKSTLGIDINLGALQHVGVLHRYTRQVKRGLNQHCRCDI
jgi:hypothetical protein